MKRETRVNHPPRVEVPADNRPLTMPIYQNVKWEFESIEDTLQAFRGERPGFFYSRAGNPTVRQLEMLLAELQGREGCLSCASGVNAVTQALVSLTRADDHVLKGNTYKILAVENGKLIEKEVPMLNALNEVLRDDYITDSKGGIERWNRVIEKAGISFKLTAPHKAFHRNIGSLSGSKITPDGRVVSSEEWMAKVGEWLPTNEDRAYVGSLMGRVVEPGKFANWIAPPVMGINRQPVDFDYVRFS